MIAVIGILFIALVIRMSFATDKAKVSGIETDFRSYQMAFKAVATENAGFSDLVDTSATNPYTELERQINKNLDPDMKISIGKDGSIKSNAADKWGNLYQGRYLPPDEDGTVEDKGAIIMLSPGSDASLGISATIENGIVVFGYLSGKSYEAAPQREILQMGPDGISCLCGLCAVLDRVFQFERFL